MKLTSSRIPLSYKLYAGFIPLLIFLIVFGFYFINFSKNIQSSFVNISNTSEELRIISKLDQINSFLGETAKTFVLTRDGELEKQYDSTSGTFDDLFLQAQSLETSASGKDILKQFATISQRLNGIELLIIVKAKAGDVDGAINLLNQGYLKDRADARRILNEYFDIESAFIKEQIQANLSGILKGGLFFFVTTFLLLFLASFIFLFILRRFIFGPILDLSMVAHRVKSGDFTAKASKIYLDEFGDLATVFNEMTLKLETLYKNQEERIRQEDAKNIELTEANQKLLELDQHKSEFLSVVAHQLRTPLSGIKWTLSMLLSGDIGTLNDEQKTFLTKGYESNTRMIALVNDMLFADRVQLGKIQYGFSHVDIVDLMDNVLFEISPQASKRNITIEYKSKFENLPQAYVDPETMRAILQNLLENAIKYTIQGGKIQIDVKKDKDFLTISVSDNGIGIPEDQSKDIFARFFRARNAVMQETDGSGLGLYIAKNLVEKNGGKIWFDSVLGKGTTFYFTVPYEENAKKE